MDARLGCRGRQAAGQLQQIQRGPRVAVGPAADSLQDVGRRLEVGTAEAALRVGEGAAQDQDDFRFGERLEDQNLGARQQGCDHLEGGVLGGGADQGDGPALDVGEEGVLLCLVEAMDLVHEQDGPLPPAPQSPLRLGDDLLDLLDPRGHGGEGNEGRPDVAGDQHGERRLARSRRAPEDEGGNLPLRQCDPQDLSIAQEMGLADELLQAARPHPIGQRRALLGGGGFAGKQLQGHGSILEAAEKLVWLRCSGPNAADLRGARRT